MLIVFLAGASWPMTISMFYERLGINFVAYCFRNLAEIQPKRIFNEYEYEISMKYKLLEDV